MRTRATEDWPAAARDILDRACRAFGGDERWRTDAPFRLERTSLGGPLPALKGFQRTFWFPSSITLWPREGRAEFADYPRSGETGTFDNGDVALFDGAGLRHAHSANHRASFRGLAKLRRWNALDALYFFGYAAVHYYSVPFTLRQASFVRLRKVGELDALTVEYAQGAHTHSRRETFYFDAAGLIARHDYVAEIIGWWAAGAHFSSDYALASAMPMARTRRVAPRLGALHLPFTVLRAQAAAVSQGERCPAR